MYCDNSVYIFPAVHLILADVENVAFVPPDAAVVSNSRGDSFGGSECITHDMLFKTAKAGALKITHVI